MTFFQRLTRPKQKEPTEAELARERVQHLAQAMNERRPIGNSSPPQHLRIVSSRSLEIELTDEVAAPSGKR